MTSLRTIAAALVFSASLCRVGTGCGEKPPAIPPQDGKSVDIKGKGAAGNKGAVEKFDTVPLPPKG